MKRRILALLICFSVILNLFACEGDVPDEETEGKFNFESSDEKLNEIMHFVLERQEKNCKDIGVSFLHSTNSDGIYSPVDASTWTSGFYMGLNYLCYEMSGSAIFKATNDLLLLQMPPYTSMGHDIGMVFSPSVYADYKIFGTASSAEKTVAAAEALAARFKENGNYIKAWDWGTGNDYRMIIDTMYNLPILYRAYEITGDESFYDILYAHSVTAMTYLVRDDYTTAHTFIFNPDGTPSHEKTHQGYADDSCWARGQAWAITGFAMAYRFTGDEEFLDLSIALAEKYIELAEDNLIPKWDLSLKGDPEQPVDTSAAAIAANGFMEIYELSGKEEYRDLAYDILVELYENYSSKDAPARQGLICEAVGNMPSGKDISVSLIYGDYFFVELLSRFLGSSRGYW